ncbi:hypothetical protein [Tenacibaculum sp. IB213877]|uniref:hypothetical protein n=1 Tax=Tenacibaculum sp. IB213877 TaxID=3097351 RepID=UPI002A5A6318|nr:hypothetical protein [Tenacibaculum sp. IB213877]MDY0780814.1 hypothetical protein [Tenacibaculum sp. IB213877]
MKKSILNLGKALSKSELLQINGGAHEFCITHKDCPAGQGCCLELGLCFRDDYPRCDLI